MRTAGQLPPLWWGQCVAPCWPGLQLTLAGSATQLLLLDLQPRQRAAAGLARLQPFARRHHLQLQPTPETCLQPWLQWLFAHFPQPPRQGCWLALGTAFQRRVWQALQEIPPGQTRSYGQLAAAIGQPTACRAVARALAANPLLWLQPCHRIVPATGGLGGFRAGSTMKRQLLVQEGWIDDITARTNRFGG
ncbi:MAG: methylated-DNA--[protein]-cysteine S-methyltransferase [Desulfuromonas sp.]|nr:MGMT family protein [Desulfuromonas thiophila]